MKFNLKSLFMLSLLITFSFASTEFEDGNVDTYAYNYENKDNKVDPTKLSEPQIVKVEEHFYNGPPNFSDKEIIQTQDAFNPGNHPENIPEYPSYDVLPAVNHFYEGVVKVPKEAKITVDEAASRMKAELSELTKELFKGDKDQLKKIREQKAAYDSNFLRNQMKINKILELEAFVKKAKK